MRRCYCTGNPPSPSGFPITKLLSRCGCRCCRHKHSATFLSLRLARFTIGLSLVACFQAFYTLSSLRSLVVSTPLSRLFLLFPLIHRCPRLSSASSSADVSSVLSAFVRLPLASLRTREQHRRRLPRADTCKRVVGKILRAPVPL